MRYLTAGESHGRGLVAILEGMPAHLQLNIEQLNRELFRRMQGYGRGGRMQIESDRMQIYAGVRGGETLGSPIAFVIENRDYAAWETIMGAEAADTSLKRLTAVRPGHADLAGCIKYAFDDARNILERASARETAARVGVGALCKQLLSAVGIEIGSHVTEIAGVKSDAHPTSAAGLNERADASPVRALSGENEMQARIDACRKAGDTAGGEIEILVSGMPVGIGSHVQADRKLDGRLAGALMSIQAVKSVAVGLGGAYASVSGSGAHDAMQVGKQGEIVRTSNRAGGIEGGISNGETIVLRAVVKPIPTLMQGLPTVDIATGRNTVAAPERSDVCAVPAAGVVAEAVAAFVLADALLEVTGGDTMAEVAERVAYLRSRGVRK